MFLISDLQPPLHMPIAFGPVVSKKVSHDGNRGKKGLKASQSTQPVMEESPLDLSFGNKFCVVCDSKIQVKFFSDS